MMPVSLDCPLLIAPSVFSNVYLYNIEHPKFTEYCFVCGNEVEQTLVTVNIATKSKLKRGLCGL
jgi:hypothetical protein